MTKVLFCGGSHLAHAKTVIDQWAQLGGKDFEIEYLVTAGVQVRKWLTSGKQFTYSGEKGIILPRVNLNTRSAFFPSSYDYVIIIGNYYLPRRLLDFVKLWRMPMTDTIEKEVIVSSFFDVPLSAGKSFRNNLVDIIAQHKGSNTELMLIPDPRMVDVVEKLPLDFIERYYTYLSDYLEKKNYKYVPHDIRTINPETGSSLEHLKRTSDDLIHMSEEYWVQQMQPVLSSLK